MNNLNQKLIEQYREKVMRLMNKIAEHEAEIVTTEAFNKEFGEWKVVFPQPRELRLYIRSIVA